MPPKRVVYVQPGGSRRQPKGYFASTYDTLTSPENSAMVKAIASFTVRLLPFLPFLPSTAVQKHSCTVLIRQ